LKPFTDVMVTMKFAGVPAVTVKDVGAVMVKSGGRATPVPVRAINCGLVLSASVSFSVADSAAATEGVNVTLTVQEAPAAMLAPQVLAETT
jgi:hypothetical protein